MRVIHCSVFWTANLKSFINLITISCFTFVAVIMVLLLRIMHISENVLPFCLLLIQIFLSSFHSALSLTFYTVLLNEKHIIFLIEISTSLVQFVFLKAWKRKRPEAMNRHNIILSGNSCKNHLWTQFASEHTSLVNRAAIHNATLVWITTSQPCVHSIYGLA